MGRVYAVASGKGGVGKTTTAATLGAVLASADASVAVVDADLGMANLGPALGVGGGGSATDGGDGTAGADDGPPTLHDVLAGEATVAEATRDGPDGLAVLPGSRDLDAFADARPETLGEVVGTLADEYDHVFVDSGAGLSTDSLAPLRTADEVILVATPDRDALRNADKTAEVCRRLGASIRGLVLTRADEGALDRVRDLVDHEVLGAVPDDPAVSAALEAATPLPRHAPGSPSAAAYRDLARTLTGVDVPEPETARDVDAAVGAEDPEATAGDVDAAVGAEDPEATADEGGERSGTTADGSDGVEEEITDVPASASAAGDEGEVSRDAAPADSRPSDGARSGEPVPEGRIETDVGDARDAAATDVEEDGPDVEAGVAEASDDADDVGEADADGSDGDGPGDADTDDAGDADTDGPGDVDTDADDTDDTGENDDTDADDTDDTGENDDTDADDTDDTGENDADDTDDGGENDTDDTDDGGRKGFLSRLFG